MEKRYLQREGEEDKERIFNRYKLIIENVIGIAEEKNNRVLDIGCGQGYGMRVLSEAGYNVVGVDTDEVAMWQYKDMNDGYGIFFQGKVGELKNFPNQSFDYITAVEIIEHLPKEELDACLEEAYLLLQKDGLFIVVMPERRLEIKEYPSGAHFREYKLEEFLPIASEWFKLVKYFGKSEFDNRSEMYVFKKK